MSDLTPPEGEIRQNPVKTLHFDDHKGFAEMFGLALGMRGEFTVDWKPSVEDSRQMTPKELEQYELIVVDGDLKDGTGEDIIKEVRDKGYSGPIAAMTGRQDYLAKPPKVEGADVTLVKGMPMDEMLSGLKRLISTPPSQKF